MRPIPALLLAVAIMLAAPPAPAAEAVFPPGSRIGIVPPEGMVASKSFFGFEDADKQAGIILVTLPGEAYADLDKTVGADALKRQGLTLESREAVTLPTGKAFLAISHGEVEKVKLRKWILIASTPALTALVTAQIPDTAKSAYPDKAVRAALTSLAVRDTVPVEEQLSLLPFKVGDLAGFHVGGVLPGRAVMLTDAAVGPPQLPGAGAEPHFFAAVSPGAPDRPDARETFARDVFATVPNIKEARITTLEPLRIGGQAGHQIIAEGKHPVTGDNVTVVQWLRFGGGGFLQMVGLAKTDAWLEAYQRFRTVRDSIEPK
jgi:hypothetical protein